MSLLNGRYAHRHRLTELVQMQVGMLTLIVQQVTARRKKVGQLSLYNTAALGTSDHKGE